MTVVETKGLSKDYVTGSLFKKSRRALDRLDLQVREGEVFGLIGPNGAGKSTTIKLLMGLIFPTEGEARILGRRVDDPVMKAQIGYLPEHPYFYDHLTGRELLNYFGQLFGLKRAERAARTDELLRRVGLEGEGDVQLRKYSKGMTQRIGIAQALVNRPRLVFLDEPMSGLDPVGRREMILLVHELRDQGVTVVFCSHILHDVESLCDRVAMLNRGKLVREGRLTEILQLAVRGVEVVVENLSERAASKLSSTGAVRRLGSRWRVELDGPEAVDEVLRLCQGNGARLVSVNPVKQTLEEYFVKKLSEGDAQPAEVPSHGSSAVP